MKIAVAVVVVLAIYDVAAGRGVVLAGLVTVGPCLAATSGHRRDVFAVGAFTFGCILIVSWPDHLWGTLHQLLYLLAVVAVTGVSGFVAGRRQRGEAEAELAEERLAGAFEAVTIGLALVHSATDALDEDNRAQLDGFPTNALAVNSALASMFHWTGGPAPEALSRLLMTATDEKVEREVGLSDDRTLHVRLLSTPLSMRDDRQKLRLVQLENVSAQRLAEKQLVHVAAQQEQSHRLESLGQLAGGIAHDFNNLLAVIMNYSAFVREELVRAIDSGAPAWEPVEQDVQQIERAAERAAGLTHQLLAFARREVIRPRELALNDVVSDVEQLLRRTLGEHIELTVEGAADLWLVTADPGQIEQVLVNLAVNARDAMQSGGTLAIDTANVDVDEDYSLGRPGLSRGRHVRLRVSDTGTGMEPAVVERAFEPFFTTKPKGEGTGLGLATIYGIVTQAGGRAQIYSEPGVGTTFTALFPATDEIAPRSPQGQANQEGVRGNETILVVEDEAAVRDVAERILSRNGYHVMTASNGPDALDIVSRTNGPIHLLLTDVVMPKMAGREVAERLRALRPGLPVLFMSGYAEAVLGPGGTLDPGMLLVEKPFTGPVLLARIREALGTRTVDGPGQ